MNRCPRDGYLVGGRHDLPADPTDFAIEGLSAIGCNRLYCAHCAVLVRNAPGLSILTPDDAALAALYDAPDVVASPAIEPADPGRRLYLCRCSRWIEDNVQPLEDQDAESFRASPNVPWRCAGHPPIVLPHDLDGSVVSSQAELVGLVHRAFRGEYPSHTLAGDASRRDWRIRLHARLLPVDAAAIANAVTECLDDPDPRVLARALRFFEHVWHKPARERLLELLVRGQLAGVADEVNGLRTLEETVWYVLGPMVDTPGPARDRARAEALGGHGSSVLFRALAAGDTEWFLSHGPEMARATPAAAEDLFNSFAQVPDKVIVGTRKLATDYGEAHDRVRRTIAELITLEQALNRTSFPLAAWDCSEHYRARLCIFAVASWGAMLMKAEVVEPGELEAWNERALAREGLVGATHSHSQLVWTFGEDRCGVWNKIRELVRGDRRRLLLKGSFVPTADITQVNSFVEAAPDHVHRGVRCALASGEQVVVHEEHDDDPPKDPEYTGEYVELQSAWVSYLGADLATWLGVPHFDPRGSKNNTRQREVRTRIHAFAGDLSARFSAGLTAPVIYALGSYDDQDLRLRWAPDLVDSNVGVLTLLITLRGRARERVMKRGALPQVIRYLRHFITPRRLLAACDGGY